MIDGEYPSLATRQIPLDSFYTSIDPRFSDLKIAPERMPVEIEQTSVWDNLLSDQARFYSEDNLLALGLAFGVGAIFANSSLDATLQAHAQSSLHNASTDSWLESLHAGKELGNGLYTVPIMGSLWIANEWVDGTPGFRMMGKWGERSLRGILVGAVPLLATQRLTGGSRPGENPDGSQWHPFQDDNGVSGHAFMSSIPFITAAKMSEGLIGKSFWYTVSLIGPLSRVNDNAHYPSQVGLGWAIGFVAATAVSQTEASRNGWRVVPENGFQSSGLSLQYRW